LGAPRACKALALVGILGELQLRNRGENGQSGLGTHLFVRVLRQGIFSGFESTCHLLLPV